MLESELRQPDRPPLKKIEFSREDGLAGVVMNARVLHGRLNYAILNPGVLSQSELNELKDAHVQLTAVLKSFSQPVYFRKRETKAEIERHISACADYLRKLGFNLE